MGTDLRLALQLPAVLDSIGRPSTATDDGLLVGPLPDLPVTEQAYVVALRFLVSYRGHTLAAYRRDLTDYFTWCAAHDVPVLEAGRSTIDTYARHLGEYPRGRTGRPLSPATIARRLVTLSGYYRYAVSEDVIRRNPVDHVRRPKVGQDSPSLGLDKDEAKRLLRAAKRHGARAHALVSLLIYDGLRISEALGANIEDMGERQAHHLLTVLRKGGIRREVTLNPSTRHAITTYLDEGKETRTEGPIFATRIGNALDRAEAWRLIRRLAFDADIPHADRISPHSLRHTFVTLSREAGVPLEDVQDHAGHADPRTTRRYDRARHSPQRSPAYRLGALLGEDD